MTNIDINDYYNNYSFYEVLDIFVSNKLYTDNFTYYTFINRSKYFRWDKTVRSY